MYQLLSFYLNLAAIVTDRCLVARDDDRGMTTETAIVTGLMAVGAVAIAGIVIARATGWANSIPMPGG